MKFSEKIKQRIDCDRDYRLIVVNDKILCRHYVNTVLGSGHDLYSHRIYSGYNLFRAVQLVEPHTVIKISNRWHKFLFVSENVKRENIFNTLNLWINTPWQSAEWAYNQTPPGFIVEKFIPSPHYMYKVFCFHGKAEFIAIQKDKITNGIIKTITSSTYDRNYKYYPEHIQRDISTVEIEKSEHWNRIIEISEKLSKGWDHIRVDLFCNDNKILFSELTPYTAAGEQAWNDEFDIIKGELWG